MVWLSFWTVPESVQQQYEDNCKWIREAGNHGLVCCACQTQLHSRSTVLIPVPLFVCVGGWFSGSHSILWPPGKDQYSSSLQQSSCWWETKGTTYIEYVWSENNFRPFDKRAVFRPIYPEAWDYINIVGPFGVAEFVLLRPFNGDDIYIDRVQWCWVEIIMMLVEQIGR